MIMVILHLVYFDKVHHADCPPNLCFSAKTMKKTRAILATSAIHWCTKYQGYIAASSDKETEHMALTDSTMAREQLDKSRTEDSAKALEPLGKLETEYVFRQVDSVPYSFANRAEGDLSLVPVTADDGEEMKFQTDRLPEQSVPMSIDMVEDPEAE